MRELVFALEYEPGCNRVADALADHPDARVRSLSLHATADQLWRVDHATGTPDALDAIEDAFRNSDYYADCLATEDCGATQTTRVLDRTDDTLILYSDWERTPACASVPHIARDHLGDGVLFETRDPSRGPPLHVAAHSLRRGRCGGVLRFPRGCRRGMRPDGDAPHRGYDDISWGRRRDTERPAASTGGRTPGRCRTRLLRVTPRGRRRRTRRASRRATVNTHLPTPSGGRTFGEATCRRRAGSGRTAGIALRAAVGIFQQRHMELPLLP